VDSRRYLIVMADDFGIGMPTSQAILDLAEQGIVKATVLLVNSPFAEEAIAAWRGRGCKPDLGWHPCLTMDRPVCRPDRVPSLVDAAGRFLPLGRFLGRLFAGRIRAAEVRAELAAQEQRFCDLAGREPAFVNGHHHVHAFAPVGDILAELLSRRQPLPYIRRVREPWSMLARVPGARVKRAFLSWMGRRSGRLLDRLGFPGNDSLAGVTNPAGAADPAYLTRWLARIPGRIVELACHPGYLDLSLVGRDCARDDGLLQRRVDETHCLQAPGFATACQLAGLVPVSPEELFRRQAEKGDERAA
jgi:chitin disaccharide deacetylase